MSTLEIEICPHEPRASAYLSNGQEINHHSDIGLALADCTLSGDNEPACRYVLEEHKPQFRIIARNPESDKYENRSATDSEICQTARAIYFDSDSDLDNNATLARIYLIWEAAHSWESEQCD